MSDIRSSMSSIPADRWELAFGKKEEKDEWKTVGYVDVKVNPPLGYIIHEWNTPPETQEC